MRIPVLLASLALAGLAACAPRPAAGPDWRETLTQVSTYEALKAGRYDGQLAVSNLLAYGDIGLGTFAGLDGEMIVLDGRVFHVAADGAVREAEGSAGVPFANVTWFSPDLQFDVGAMNQAVFQNTMRWKRPDARMSYALRVRGRFASLRLRSVPGQTEPYPPLERVVAEQQRVFEPGPVSGTMVGFLIPDDAGPLMPSGFHLHFLSDDGKVGGHVLDFALAQGRIELDETPVLQILLPPRLAPK